MRGKCFFYHFRRFQTIDRVLKQEMSRGSGWVQGLEYMKGWKDVKEFLEWYLYLSSMEAKV